MDWALTKFPVLMFLICIVMVNGLFSAKFCKFKGFVNLDEGILLVPGIWPMGAGLHLRSTSDTSRKKLAEGAYDPVVICFPLVIGWFVVAQKLIKLFDDVKEGTWPASATAWPFCSKPVAITLGSSAAEISSQ